MSRELATFSAAEIEGRLLDEGRERIDKAQLARIERLRDEAINAHYEARARKLMFKLWRDCGRRSKHEPWKRVKSDSTYGSPTRYYCDACGAPIHHVKLARYLGLKKGWILIGRRSSRVKEGIAEVAKNLRAADREAQVEWVPSK